MSGIVDCVLAVGLGLIFLASALPKLRHPAAFLLVVMEYRVLPVSAGRLYALACPFLEMLAATLLLTGTAVRIAATLATLLLVSFLVGVGINVMRGRDLSCGCFGGRFGQRIGAALVIQDGILVGGGIGVAMLAHHWLVTESWSVFDLIGPLRSAGVLPGILCSCITVITGVLLEAPAWRRNGLLGYMRRAEPRRSELS